MSLSGRKMRKIAVGCILIALICGVISIGMENPAGAKTKLTLAFAGTPEMNQGIVDAARAFEKANPDIEVVLQPFPSEYYDKLKLMAMSGTAPDVALVAYQFLPPFIAMDVLIDLMPFLEQPGGLEPKDYVPTVMEALSHDGKLYALPRDFTPVSMFININLFEDAGVPVPDKVKPMTTDEYVDVGRKLTKDLNGDKLYDQFLATSFIWEAAVQIFDGRLWDHPWKPTRSTANDPKVMEALDWVRDLREKYRVLPWAGQPAPAFTSGKVATYFTGRYEVPNFRKQLDFDWDVRPFIQGRVRRPWHGGSGWMAFKTRNDPAKVWRLVSWLGGPEGQKFEIKSGRIVPALFELLTSDVFLNDRPPANQRVWLEDMMYARRAIFLEYDQMMQAIGPALNQFWQGKVSSQWLVTQMERVFNSILGVK